MQIKAKYPNERQAVTNNSTPYSILSSTSGNVIAMRLADLAYISTSLAVIQSHHRTDD